MRITDLLRSRWQVRILSEKDTNELQNFLDQFEDFFLLCEGEVGNADGLLTACPPQKKC